MKVLYTNAKIIDGKNCQLKDVDILTNDDIIEQIFAKGECDIMAQDAKIVNSEGNVFISGFINPNSHLLENFYESFSENHNYSDFSFAYSKFLENLSEEEKYIIYKFQILNLVKSGITTFCDEDFYNLSLKKAVKECDVNCVYKLCFCEDRQKNSLGTISRFSIEKTPFVFGLKSVFENTEDDFSNMIFLSKKHKKPLFVRGSLSLYEAGVAQSDFQKSAIELLSDYGALDVDCVVVNNNILDIRDHQILNSYGTKLIFSPSFNLSFGFENVNIYSLSQTNPIGIASYKNNYILETFLTNNLQKNAFDRFDIFSYSHLFELATKENAHILGLKNDGEIKAGFKANFVVLSNTNLLQNANLFLKNIQDGDIKSVIVNGKLVFNNNHFVENYHYDNLKKQCKEIIAKHLKLG